MKTVLRGKKLTVDMNQKEEDVFFRKGLQIIIDRDYKGKVKVLPPSINLLNDKDIKKVEADDKMIEMCVKEGIIDAIKHYIEKHKKIEKEKSKKKK